MKIFLLKPSYILALSLFLLLHSFPVISEEEESVYSYNRIPGCSCFNHCSCFTSVFREVSNQYDHPSRPADVVWHVFREKIKESWMGGPSIKDIRALLGGSSHKCYMLSEYLDVVEFLNSTVEEEGRYWLKEFQKIYNEPRDAKDLKRFTDKIPGQVAYARGILSTIPGDIIPLYRKILDSCPHRGPHNLALIYNEGFLGFITGDYETSLDRINEFVVFAETSHSGKDLLNSQIYQKQGESLLEVGLYHEAISALTKALEKDPTNKEVYFSRAAANFEAGNFDSAVQDYISSEAQKNILRIESKVSSEFSSALLSGVLEGGKEAALEFVPSLCNTACGLGECLWSFIQQPQDATVNFCNACYETGEAVTEYINNLDQEKIDGIADEIIQVYQKFDSLNDADKGQAIGYCVGKYGIDIFAGGATLKCAAAVKNLKHANRLCNLETIAASETSREAITVAALKHAADREAFFKNVKIHWERQNKHVPGKHNFDAKRGCITITNNQLEELIEKNIGKGQKVNDNIAFSAGYRERIDFSEIIGNFAFSEEGKEIIFIPTTRGILHYSKEGVHLIPSAPNGFRK